MNARSSAVERVVDAPLLQAVGEAARVEPRLQLTSAFVVEIAHLRSIAVVALLRRPL